MAEAIIRIKKKGPWGRTLKAEASHMAAAAIGAYTNFLSRTKEVIREKKRRSRISPPPTIIGGGKGWVRTRAYSKAPAKVRMGKNLFR